MVLVITGKGGRGDGERGVLKRPVPMWLTLPEFREYVVGFDAAPSAMAARVRFTCGSRKRRAVIS